MSPNRRGARQGAVALHGIDPARQMRQDRGLKAGAGSDLQHLVALADLQRLRHLPDDRGLADGLAAGDRQGHVVIGAVLKMAGDEQVARNPLHRVQHVAVGDTGVAQRQHVLHQGFRIDHAGKTPFSASNWSWAVRSARIGVTAI